VTGRVRTNERVRVPAPVIGRRVASGRGATEQPNAGPDGEAALTARFWVLVVVTGVATGLLADLMMAVLFHVEHAAYAYRSGSFLTAVSAVSAGRRIVDLLIAGVVGGLGWYLLRRIVSGRSEIDDALWSGTGDLSFRRSLGTSLLSEVVIGLGASLGRESAPKLMGGAAGSLLARVTHLTSAQQRLLVACGGGAGLAAVYDVPLGGALFTAEILVGSLALPTVLPALVCSAVATITGWLYLPDQATYTDIPSFHSSPRIIVWALVAGPLIGILASGYVRLIGWVTHHRVRGPASLFAPLLAFGILGLAAIAYPQLLGNGKGIAHAAFAMNGTTTGAGALVLLLTLAVAKPLVTALCLSSGASGGLFTPVLATGGALGAGLGILWSNLWPGSPAGAYAMVGATAMIGAAMQAPLAALVLVLELTHTGFDLMVPMLVATAAATAVTRYLDGYSIYSARLPARDAPAGPASR
jgi:CIC family chloride channel protein